MSLRPKMSKVSSMTLLKQNRTKKIFWVFGFCLSSLWLLSTALHPVHAAASDTNSSLALTCSIQGEAGLDKDLVEMTYDVGDGPQTTLVYVEPQDIADFYLPGEVRALTKVVPKFNGFSGKFINMSNKPVSFYWEEYEGGPKHAMRHMLPFGATGTATFPGHRFLMTEANKPDNILQAFVIKEYPENIYYYDPYHVPDDPVQTEKNLADNLKTDEERKYYNQWRKTILFNEQYKAKTGRSYLANYLRAPPRHYMWPADYIDQEHWVTTKETHFVSLPPINSPELKEINSQKPRNRILAEDAPRLLQEYREPDTEVRNLTLKVLSVAPRVYQIDNFLSPTEVEHIMELAKGIELAQSTVGETHKGEEVIGEEEKTSKTRTSYNSWVPRERTPVVDAVYRRAADVLRIDESLLRSRAEDEEWSIKTGTRRGIAEQLQLVHYGKRQEYTAHHDFGFSHISSETQDARFATLLLYLNEDVEGGETSFPRWVNDRTFHPLKIKPKTGMAALFYSQLPDGNLDDFSQHAAEPVKSGEKWLINLWVHDPIYED